MTSMSGWASARRGATVEPVAVASADAGPRTTAGQVEFAVAACMALLRLSPVIQMLPAFSTAMVVSDAPRQYALWWGLAVAASVAVAAFSLVRRRPVPDTAIYADIAFGVLLVAASAPTVPPDERFGSWIGWAGGYALAVAMGSAPLRSLAGWIAGIAAVIAGYLVYILPVPAHTVPTVIGNVLGYALLAGTVRLIVVVLRRISRAADRSRAEVARMARREEELRARVTFHDATTVMQLLATPDLPESLRAQLRAQADLEVRRMRRYLQGDSGSWISRPDDEPAPAEIELSEVIASALDGFGDLDVRTTTDAIAGVRLPQRTGAALEPAVRTILHNVRRHARTSSVVLDADETTDATGRWRVTIADDGRGFDPSCTPLGVGLRDQVIGELARFGMDVTIDSSVGRGTRIVIDGVGSR